MSPIIPVIVTLGIFSVAMVTGAPVAGIQEETVVAAKPDDTVDRAKRAEEKIFYGNEQNRPRTVVKKSDIGASLSLTEPHGEVDQGSEVIVHQAQPIEEDLKVRLEEAQKDNVDAKEFPKELEESMHSLVTEMLDGELKEEAATDNADGTSEVAEVADAAKEEAVEKMETIKTEVETPTGDIIQEETQTTGDAEEEEEKEEVVNEEGDDVEKALLEINSDRLSSDNMEEEQLEKEVAENEEPVPEYDEQEPYNNMGYEGGYSNPSEFFNNYLNLYQYYPRDAVRPPVSVDPYFLARRRRSAIASIVKSRHARRRIKRDLLDDLYESPALNYPPVKVDNSLLSNQDEYVPLTEDEAAVLYGRLLDYLEEVLAEEEAAATEESREEELPYEPEFFPDESAYQDQPYPADSYAPEIVSPYEEGYPYGPLDLDTYNKYSKRSRMSYYPSEEKRYFFPFNEEPETHWGAFVPEKRDYRDSISRLQRLAMALDDNPGPYYREVIDEYRRK